MQSGISQLWAGYVAVWCENRWQQNRHSLPMSCRPDIVPHTHGLHVSLRQRLLPFAANGCNTAPVFCPKSRPIPLTARLQQLMPPCRISAAKFWLPTSPFRTM